MPIPFMAPTITNATQLAGSQFEVRTAGLPNGGYVVAWQSSGGGPFNVFFQRYDAAGAQVGARTQITNPSSVGMFLRDIAVGKDGTFSVLTEGAVGPAFADVRLFVSSFFAGTGGPSGPPALLNLTAFSPFGVSGAQLVPGTAVSSMVVLASVPDAVSGQDLIQSVVTTAGVVSSAPVVVTNAYPGIGIIEAVESIGPQQFAVSDGTIIDTVGSFATVTSSLDVISLQPGNIVVARPGVGIPQVVLTLLFGETASAITLGTSGGVVGTNAQGLTSTGAQSFDIELVDLGAGRILVVWVADGGDGNPGASALLDGVYAQVYNMNTGGPEGPATQILNFGVGSNDATLQSIGISADRMSDGRVALGLSYNNGLSGLDVFNSILDPRISGVTVAAASNGVDIFIGTAFADTFTGISTGDQIAGGLGVDTVVFGNNTARSVDLQNPGAFPANTFILSGIENVTGANLADAIRGDALANVLTGLAANDTLHGRDGNDSLFGGTNDDLLFGGSGGDLLDGSTGFDKLDGGAGADLIVGGADDDRLIGGGDADTLNGDDGNDRVFGGDGDDSLAGGIGDDLLSGGAGNDGIVGGDGNDTLGAEQGDDTAQGGDGNDIIYVSADTAIVDGGAGTDTVQFDSVFAIGTSGVLIDLTAQQNLFNQPDDYTLIDADISAVENVTGSGGNDFIVGDSAANVLRGGAGNDFLVGGTGVDTLFGGLGVDVFVFTGLGQGVDVIRDFVVGEDKIGLVELGFGDVTRTFFSFTASSNAAPIAAAIPQFLFDNSGAGYGQLTFDADGNGAGVGVLVATFSSPPFINLTASDFIFV